MTQEEVTHQLAQRLKAKVVTIGHHGNVRSEVACDGTDVESAFDAVYHAHNGWANAGLMRRLADYVTVRRFMTRKDKE
jgi:hypothetical protein